MTENNKKSSNLPPINERKGARIKIVVGTYKGLRAWVDTAKECTRYYTPVIIQVKSNPTVLKATRIQHTSFVMEAQVQTPSNKEEAMIFENADMLEMFTVLTRKMAEFEEISASGEGGKRIATLFLKFLNTAISEQNALPNEKARWRRIKFNGGSR